MFCSNWFLREANLVDTRAVTADSLLLSHGGGKRPARIRGHPVL